MTMQPSSAFSYWQDGNTNLFVDPDPPSTEEAKPYVVSLQAKNHIPMFLLVFARDKDHAKNRVLKALKECQDKDYKGAEGTHLGVNNAYRILGFIQDGEYEFTAQLIDTNIMTRLSRSSLC